MSSRLPVLAALPLLGLLGCANENTLNSGTPTDRPPTNDVLGDSDTVDPIAVCGASPGEIGPGGSADFIGENSYDADDLEITGWTWQLIQYPEGSRARLPTRNEANVRGFSPDVIGTYVVSLSVRNENGRTSQVCSTDLLVAPPQDLYIEARPRYPDDDLQLELSNGSTTCSLPDCNLEWGAAGGKDNPRFLKDDYVDGIESVAIPEPANGTYTLSARDVIPPVGKLRLADNDVEFTIYVNGQESWSGVRRFCDEGNNVQVATITWPGGKITPLDTDRDDTYACPDL